MLLVLAVRDPLATVVRAHEHKTVEHVLLESGRLDHLGALALLEALLLASASPPVLFGIVLRVAVATVESVTLVALNWILDDAIAQHADKVRYYFGFQGSAVEVLCQIQHDGVFLHS